MVDERHLAVGPEGQERHADVPHDGLEVARLLLALGPERLKCVADAAERRRQRLERGAAAFARDALRGVVVAQAFEKPGEVAGRLLGIAHEGRRHGQPHQPGDERESHVPARPRRAAGRRRACDEREPQRDLDAVVVERLHTWERMEG